VTRRRDIRPFIYLGLDVLAVAVYVIAIVAVIPNRLPNAAIQLWSLPVCMLVTAVGTATIFLPKLRANGRRVAIVGGSLVLVSMIVLIIRVLVSAAFLAGVYGAFGKAAATFALVAIALVVEVVAILPIVQVKYLMSRAGQRAYAK
jgi:hypothetical protein